MRILGVLFGMVILSAGAGARQVTEPPFEVPLPLAELLSGTGEDGQALITADAQVYFDKLPANAKRMFVDAVTTDLLSSTEQLSQILSLELRADRLEIVLGNSCILCHTNPDYQDTAMLFSTDPGELDSPAHMNLREVVNDVHFRRGLSCAGCHGGDPTAADMSDEIYERWPAAEDRAADSSWIPAFCARCHSDPNFMRGFNPSLPTDQLAKYRQSRHGKLLLGKGDDRAAQCVSCHGVHGIRGPKSPRSKVHPKRVPETCGGCHANAEHMAGFTLADGSPMPINQLEEYRTSVHGLALLERGDLGAPACNDCHGNHAALPPEVASVAQICRTCHAVNGRLFDGSEHKRQFERHGWPECGQCHGKHAIARTSDDMVGSEPGSLCYDCHQEYAANNPRCTATATYFRTTIGTLVGEIEHFELLVHELAEKGLDVDPLTETVDEMHDTLRLSRSQIHAFEWSEFFEVAERGRLAIEEGRELAETADKEYRLRRIGLAGFIGWMGLLAGVIYFRLRQVERGA